MMMKTRREIADQLMTACTAAGTTHIFGMPGGGSNLDVAGAAVAHGLEFVLVHTETAGAIMASVMGELTGAPSMCIATRGPGAASAVNGVATALVDRQPMLLVTDCVAENERDRVSHQRIDQQALFAPISLASIVLNGTDPEAASAAVALTGGFPPGPVHIDLDPSAAGTPVPARVAPTRTPIEPVVQLIQAARRPVIIAGTGIAVSQPEARDRLTAAINEIGRTHHVPVLCTYKARGVVPDDAPYNAGWVTGSTIEAAVLNDADLIIGIGFDPVEYLPTAWPYSAPVVVMGSWPLDDGSYTRSTYLGDSVQAESIGDLNEMVSVAADAITSEWAQGDGQNYRQAALNRLLTAASPDPQAGLTPQQVVTSASAAAPRGAIATVDAGAHMLVSMPLWNVDEPEQLLISSSYATMGFALPAAIAASLARPGTPVVCFTGDGGLGMVLNELETVARLGLPIIVVVFNDATLSLIAAKQHPVNHGGSLAVDFTRTDFASVARGCGMKAETIDDVPTYDEALRAAFASGQPTLLDVRVDRSVYGSIMDVLRG